MTVVALPGDAGAGPPGPGQPGPRRPMAAMAGRFRRNRAGMVALGFVVLMVAVAVAAPLLAPHDPRDQELRAVLAEPGGAHLLGTDDLGRDLLSRVLFASRVSLLAAAEAVGISVVLGVPLGLAAGYRGGLVDAAIMRVTDAVLALPPLILAIAIVGVLGPGLSSAMVAVGLVFAPRFTRLVRASVQSVRQETFVEASRSIGTPWWRIVSGHVLPNVTSPLIVQVSLAGGFAMLAEAGLSFLGLGVQPPEASWGSLLGRAFPYINQAPWLVIFPGLAIALTVLAFNVVGDALRDAVGREDRAR